MWTDLIENFVKFNDIMLHQFYTFYTVLHTWLHISWQSKIHAKTNTFLWHVEINFYLRTVSLNACLPKIWKQISSKLIMLKHIQWCFHGSIYINFNIFFLKRSWISSCVINSNCFEKFYKNHRKASMVEIFFSNIACCRRVTLVKKKSDNIIFPWI